MPIKTKNVSLNMLDKCLYAPSQNATMRGERQQLDARTDAPRQGVGGRTPERRGGRRSLTRPHYMTGAANAMPHILRPQILATAGARVRPINKILYQPTS